MEPCWKFESVSWWFTLGKLHSEHKSTILNMQGYSALKCFCATLCVIIVVAEMVSAAPPYADYESSIRDLYELLLQKDALEERLGAHQVVRKSSRSPSLRLRFGRRSDPSLLPASQYILAQEAEHGDN